MRPLLKQCKCGFGIDAFRDYTDREKMKIFKEHLITAKLFGCEKCIKKIQIKINKLRNK